MIFLPLLLRIRPYDPGSSTAGNGHREKKGEAIDTADTDEDRPEDEQESATYFFREEPKEKAEERKRSPEEKRHIFKRNPDTVKENEERRALKWINNEKETLENRERRKNQTTGTNEDGRPERCLSEEKCLEYTAKRRGVQKTRAKDAEARI